LTAHILKLSDGRRSAAQIAAELSRRSPSVEADNLEWIEKLFVCGLIGLDDSLVVSATERSPATSSDA
jgi:hypothetical protein